MRLVHRYVAMGRRTRQSHKLFGVGTAQNDSENEDVASEDIHQKQRARALDEHCQRIIRLEASSCDSRRLAKHIAMWFLEVCPNQAVDTQGLAPSVVAQRLFPGQVRGERKA